MPPTVNKPLCGVFAFFYRRHPTSIFTAQRPGLNMAAVQSDSLPRPVPHHLFDQRSNRAHSQMSHSASPSSESERYVMIKFYFTIYIPSAAQAALVHFKRTVTLHCIGQETTSPCLCPFASIPTIWSTSITRNQRPPSATSPKYTNATA